jgi:hypothetical protein
MGCRARERRAGAHALSCQWTFPWPSPARRTTKMKYRIYIDEVGNPDLDSSDNPNHRFLSLTGAILELGYVQAVLHPQMEKLKADFFLYHPDEPVIFHRKELVNARRPFESLRDCQVRRGFDQCLLALLAAWEYTLITICLDKKEHKETYTTWRYDPYHYCLALLLERFALFLQRADCCGDAMAESRGGKEDRRLKNSFAKLWAEGTHYISKEAFQSRLTSKQLKVKTKANNIAGLQLADLLAHPSRNEILTEHGHLAKPLAPFAQRIVSVIRPKYDQVHGRIEGIGKKMI